MQPLKLLKTICDLPTAPFVEQRVEAFIVDFVRQRPSLRIRRDTAGNLLILLPSKRKQPRWIFTAHMDHPGFIAETRNADGNLVAGFNGYVRAEFIDGCRVRFFARGQQFVGHVKGLHVDSAKRKDVPAQVVVAIRGDIAPGSIGMFDIPEGHVRGNIFHGRVCDDLAGVAACLAMLDGLIKNPPGQTVGVLLTRAEEEGFIGCIAACIDKSLLKADDRIVAIECSAAQAHAPQGKGCIIRVGDRTSIFDSALTYFMTGRAAALAKSDKNFTFQRSLMPGGTCEATAYGAFGFTAASICVALGNYHNMDVTRGRLAAETIDTRDWLSMVKLFVALARNGQTFIPGHDELKRQLIERYEREKANLNRYAGS